MFGTIDSFNLKEDKLLIVFDREGILSKHLEPMRYGNLFIKKT